MSISPPKNPLEFSLNANLKKLQSDSNNTTSATRSQASLIFHHVYQKAVEDLKKNLNELANPFIAKDVLQTLHIASQEVLDTEIGIGHYFSKMSLPKDTRACIEELSRQITAEAREHMKNEKADEAVDAIKKDLHQLANEKIEKTYPLWSNLEILLGLDPIRELKNDDVKRIIDIIDQGNKSPLKNILSELLKVNVIEKLDEQLEEEFGGFEHLLSQVIKQKPPKKEDLLTYWNQPSSFFKDKTFYLTDISKKTFHKGTIVDCVTNDRGKTFRLHDESEVQITNEYKVTLVKKHTYKFWNAIQNGFLDNQDFEISIQSDRFIERNIKPGRYIKKIKRIQSKTTCYTNEIKLIGLNNIDRYKILANYKNDKDKTPTLTLFKCVLMNEYENFDDQTFIKSNIIPTLDRMKQEKKSYTNKAGFFPFKEVTTGEKYLIRDYTNNECRIADYIVYHRLNKSNYELLNDQTAIVELNTSYNAIKSETNTIQYIDQNNVDKFIIIKNEKDENKIKLLHLSRIKEQIKSIYADLLSAEYRELLNILLDNLFSNHLKKIDSVILDTKKPDLAKRLNMISEQYRDHLQMTHSAEEILKKIVGEAIYAILVDKDQSGIVSKTMELLKKSDCHLENIKGKKAVFFMGPTGSGKSSAICYFLGAKMDTFVNRAGDKVYQITNKELQKNFPIIGQSLTNSETIYAQGYSLPSKFNKNNPDILFVDCPGFEDNRGEDYELCANMSIDQAVLQSESIKAVVVVIPIQAFLLDRANFLLNLVAKIQERFPHTFDSDHPENNAGIYFLITKSIQAQPETVDKLSTGERINQLVEETKVNLKALRTSQQEGKNNDVELLTVQRKYNIWKAIQQMQSNEQIDILEIGNIQARQQLLEKYSNFNAGKANSNEKISEIDKKAYDPAMQGKEMQMKFGNYIEMSTHTWTHRIFDEYLQFLPASIDMSRGKIEFHEKDLIDLEKKREARANEITHLKKNQEDLTELIQELEKAPNDPLVQLSKEQLIDLKQRIAKTTNENLDKVIAEKKKLKEEVDVINLKKKKLEDEIIDLTKSIDEKIKPQDNLKLEINKLANGETSEILADISYKPNQILSLEYPTDKSREERFKNFLSSSYKSEEIIKECYANTSTFEGKIWEDIEIERKYTLIPTDPELREKFETWGNVTAVFDGGKYKGKYIAKIDGKQFEPALGYKASTDGKKIIYSMNTIFYGDGVLPSAKITHSIPNYVLNEATIINYLSQINIIERDISDLRVRRDGAKHVTGKEKEKENLNNEFSDLNKKISAKDDEIDRLNKGMAKQKLEEMVQEQKNELEKKKQELEKLITSTEIEDKIKAVQKEKEWEEKTLKSIKTTKRNLAMVIYNQLETAKLLRQFSALATSQNATETFGKDQRNAMLVACQDFIKTYDDNIGKLEIEYKKDLPFLT
jgi:hypothetical protein